MIEDAPTTILLAATGDTSGITKWIQNNVLGLVILVIGILIVMLAKKKDLSNALTMVAVVLVGLMVVGLSVNGNSVKVGSWLSGMIFG